MKQRLVAAIVFTLLLILISITVYRFVRDLQPFS